MAEGKEVLRIPHAIPPAAALLVVLLWNFPQWRKVGAQQEKTEMLRKRLEEAKSTKTGHKAADRPLKVNPQEFNGPMDWKILSARLASQRSSVKDVDFQEMAALSKRLAAMSREEIIAALDEIASMGLAEGARRPLEELLAGALMEVDPELAFVRLASHMPEGSDSVGGQLALALKSWARKNPVAASSWLDRQIQAGFFESRSLDGRSESRLKFEASVVGALLASDPSAARMRIAALPENQRRETLAQITFPELDTAAQTAYVELVRGLVPKDENAGSLIHIIAELIPEGGYAKVDDFLDQIHATAEERVVSARQAANSQLGALAKERAPTRDDVEAMRTWLRTQSPGNVDTVTGEALGEVVQDAGKFPFEEASMLVLDYQRSSGNDDVLVAFLRSFAARSNLKQAASLAQRIKDPAVRQEILDGLN